MTELRPYQADLAARAFRALARSGSVVVQLETGAGKTHIAAEMCRTWVREKKRVWFVAHRREILDQARAIFDEGAVAHGPRALVQFKMIAAAVKGGNALPPNIMVFDECHHAPAESWRMVAEAHPKALRLGLTATPNRLDGAPLSECFAEIERGPPPRDLRGQGYLARYRYFAPALPDLSNVKVRDKEYDRCSLAEIMTGASIVGDVVDHYRRHADGRRAILFAVSVFASQDMAQRFNDAGITARHVDAETSGEDRAAAIRSFREGKTKVLCNVELFTEGFDLPAISAVILLRPTRSISLFRQMIGRGARPTSRSDRTVILDHASLVAEHGLPDEEYVWTIDGKAPRRKAEIEGGRHIRMRRCPVCNAVHEWAAACEQCGHEYEEGESRTLTEIGGNLHEIAPRTGEMSVKQYAKTRRIAQTTLYRMLKLGMPRREQWIVVDDADRWLFTDAYAKTTYCPEGYLSLKDYAAKIGRSVPFLLGKFKHGLPRHGNFVNTLLADQFLSDEKEASDRARKDGFATRTEFADLIGKKRHSLVFSIKNGMPIRKDGLIHVETAKAWFETQAKKRSDGMSARSKKMHMDASFKEAIKRGVRRYYEDESNRERAAAIGKRNWADPQIVAKIKTGMAKAHALPEEKARKSAASRKRAAHSRMNSGYAG